MRRSVVFPFVVLLTSVDAHAVTSAEFYRAEPLRYGKFEARIQFAAGEGAVSAFFLWKEGSEQSGVYWNELDFEKIGDCDLQTNSIYGDPQRGSEEHHNELTDLCSGYHTYAFEWTPETITWLVDGEEIRVDTGAAAAAYVDNAEEGMQFRFNIWPGDATFGGNFEESILPVYQYVSWIQYSEYTPGEGDEGSDFSLSWREELDSLPPGWLFGSWESPLGHSTHSAQNADFLEGVLALALTTDEGRGEFVTPPEDDGSSGGEPQPPAEEESEGCSCDLAKPRAASTPWLGLFVGLGLVALRRRRAQI